MKKNELFELTITDTGAGGEGIGHYDGMAFFVKDAVEGDVIKARVTKLKKNYGYARVEEVLTPSTFRVVPKCPISRQCGGCQIAMLSYERQLAFKENRVRNNLVRIGGFPEAEVRAKTLPIVGMEMPYRYRNKAQFPVGRDKNGEIIFGFYAARSHNIIPVKDCLLGVKENGRILTIIKRWMEAYQIAPYEENSRQGLVRHVLIRYGFATGEFLVCLVINGKELPFGEALAKELAEVEGMTSISYNVNRENTNVILGEKTVCIWGKPYITDSIHLWECEGWDEVEERGRSGFEMKGQIRKEAQESGTREGAQRSVTGEGAQGSGTRKEAQGSGTGEGAQSGGTREEAKSSGFVRTDRSVVYHISPQSFFQVNPLQTEKLYSTVLEFAQLTGREYVWDLYCGIGTISLFLSRKAKQVYGVEIVPRAIEDARENARLNGISNAAFFVGKAEEVLPEFYGKYKEGAEDNSVLRKEQKEIAGMARPDVIVVDPPRKGCDAKCLDTMLAMAPERIVYVSCDSATLARDLRVLWDGGYEIRKIRAFDQFGQTVHVETIVGLQRRDM